MFTFKKSTTLVDKQIIVWIAWEDRVNPDGCYLREYERWVRNFFQFINKDDVCDIEENDVESFLDHVAVTNNGVFPVRSAQKAINAIRRFYTARGKRMARA